MRVVLALDVPHALARDRGRVLLLPVRAAGGGPGVTDVHPTPRNCRACAHSYMEPDDDLTCGHPDSGPMGLYVGNGHGPDSAGGHCGATRAKFSQHPLRNPDGNIKT